MSKTKIIWYKHNKEKNTIVECDESEGVIWAIVNEEHKRIMEAIELQALGKVLDLHYRSDKSVYIDNPAKKIHWPDGIDEFVQYPKTILLKGRAGQLMIGERYMDQKKKETFKCIAELGVDMSSPPRDLEMRYYDENLHMTHKTTISYKSGRRMESTEYFPKKYEEVFIPRFPETKKPSLLQRFINLFR